MTKRKYPERKSSYQRLSSAFRSVIDNFKIAASKTDKRETTIQAEANNGSAFLLCLQDQGAKTLNDVTTTMRSEERRVGKECRSRWSPYH